MFQLQCQRNRRSLLVVFRAAPFFCPDSTDKNSDPVRVQWLASFDQRAYHPALHMAESVYPISNHRYCFTRHTTLPGAITRGLLRHKSQRREGRNTFPGVRPVPTTLTYQSDESFYLLSSTFGYLMTQSIRAAASIS